MARHRSPQEPGQRLCKILVDFAISTVAYFFIGYTIAYGVAFFVNAEALNGGAKGFDPQGLTLS